MILGAAWRGRSKIWDHENFQKHVRMFADDSRWTAFCGVYLGDDPQPPYDRANYPSHRDWLVANYPHRLALISEYLGS